LRVLLVGGTGFLGGHVGRELVAGGHHVFALSRTKPPAIAGVEHLQADRRDPSSVAAILGARRFDATVDFTAFDAADLDAVFRTHEALGRYVMISSGQVYLVTHCERMPYREADSEHPLIPEPVPGTPDHREWLYGVGKRRAERALRAFAAGRSWRPTVLRLPIVLGEADGTLRLWAYLERLLDGGPLLLPDGGGRSTRFLYAGDLARAVHRLIGIEPEGTAYNLAQPEIVPLRELLEGIAHAAGLSPRFVDATWDELEREGLERSFSPYAGPWASVLDPAAARESWGFSGTPLCDYLPAVVRWHLEHRPAGSHPGYAQRSRELEIAAARS
jgi:nucleoside-diphosphate-sugar epimerase